MMNVCMGDWGTLDVDLVYRTIRVGSRRAKCIRDHVCFKRPSVTVGWETGEITPRKGAITVFLQHLTSIDSELALLSGGDVSALFIPDSLACMLREQTV